MKRMRFVAGVFLFLLGLASARTALAQYGSVYDFEPNHGDPVHPLGTMRADAKGKLYGTAADGSTFEMKQRQNGGWIEKTTPNGPGGSDWIADGKGNFYTSVASGGANAKGAILESSRVAGEGWTSKVIYSFGASATDGAYPYGKLVFDVQGHLYGTTNSGGSHAVGTVFELTRSTGGEWTESVLYDFGASSADAANPQGLTIDASGNLYGTSSGGPSYPSDYTGDVQGGTVFELTRQQSGTWKEAVIYSFIPSITDGLGYESVAFFQPGASLVLDNKGNLYGTTDGITIGCCRGAPGDAKENGTIFELSRTSAGKWNIQDYYLDCENQAVCVAISELTLDPAGNLYLTTYGGGSNLGVPDGTGDALFKVTPQWQQTVLHSFPSAQSDGYPSGGVTLSEGNLFGLTSNGGPDAYGSVYEIQNVANPTPVETKTTLAISPTTELNPGEEVTITATVNSVTGSTFPTGTVVFEDFSGRYLGESHAKELLVAGKAVFSTVVPRGHLFAVVARYKAGPGFAEGSPALLTAKVKGRREDE